MIYEDSILTKCESETQCILPSKIEKANHVEKKGDYEKQSNNMKNNSGFFGYETIKDEQELIDLAGVQTEVFILLLKILYKEEDKLTDFRKSTENKNRLLIFLMKMKCGLSFSALGVLFNVHRRTISRIFYDTLT